ncbi:MAG TPA: biotin/lipoyl-containing protein, partial [Nitriliruptoraceae bacterium]|nr:biotin/lipoyl-containing protein [Nitriliruptoraceae bacterium]
DLRTTVSGMGLPVIVKAVSGGGGKGMRRVDDLDDLSTAVAAAAREGAAAFGDDRLLIERFVTAPRHVEIQVAGDTHGGATHLFERDCSIQRRHQKVVEEAPSPALDPGLRERMGAAAVALVEQVGYTNLGTVEFLLDTSGDGDSFFFLEMNTRLQVEHPVTELVTGLDLVGCQLDIAAGGRVPERPDSPSGHAIEVRLYAEDVPAGFLPQTGTIVDFAIPGGVRVDSAVAAGSVVSSHYDPMLAKVVAHGADRETARARLAAALDDAAVTGVVTNLDHLRAILGSDAFRDGGFTTSFLPDHLPDWHPTPPARVTVAAATAAMALDSLAGAVPREDPWTALGPWRGSRSGGWSLDWPQVGRATATTTPDGIRVHFDDDAAVDVARDGDPSPGSPDARRHVRVDGEAVAIRAWRDGDHVWVARSGHGSQRVDVPAVVAHRDASMAAGDAALTAPMPGQVLQVEVAVGDKVSGGQTLVIVEAMKMEHPVVAPGDGVVSEVRATPGDAVGSGDVLVVLHADGDEEATP